MKVKVDVAAMDKLNETLKNYPDRPDIIRIYLAGMGWGGPSFGLALDEQNENDLVDESSGIKFIIEKGLYEDHGDFIIEQVGNGFKVAPVNLAASSGCGGCSGC